MAQNKKAANKKQQNDLHKGDFLLLYYLLMCGS